jgi:hypothetical protein
MSYSDTLARVRALSEHRVKIIPKEPPPTPPKIILEPEFVRQMQTETPPIVSAVKHRSNFQDWLTKI